MPAAASVPSPTIVVDDRRSAGGSPSGKSISGRVRSKAARATCPPGGWSGGASGATGRAVPAQSSPPGRRRDPGAGALGRVRSPCGSRMSTTKTRVSVPLIPNWSRPSAPYALSGGMTSRTWLPTAGRRCLSQPEMIWPGRWRTEPARPPTMRSRRPVRPARSPRCTATVTWSALGDPGARAVDERLDDERGRRGTSRHRDRSGRPDAARVTVGRPLRGVTARAARLREQGPGVEHLDDGRRSCRSDRCRARRCPARRTPSPGGNAMSDARPDRQAAQARVQAGDVAFRADDERRRLTGPRLLQERLAVGAVTPRCTG